MLDRSFIILHLSKVHTKSHAKNLAVSYCSIFFGVLCLTYLFFLPHIMLLHFQPSWLLGYLFHASFWFGLSFLFGLHFLTNYLNLCSCKTKILYMVDMVFDEFVSFTLIKFMFWNIYWIIYKLNANTQENHTKTINPPSNTSKCMQFKTITWLQ